MFDVNSNYCYHIFYEVLLDQIINTCIRNIDMDEYLCDIDTTINISNGFASRSNGILKGATGSIDGQ